MNPWGYIVPGTIVFFGILYYFSMKKVKKDLTQEKYNEVTEQGKVNN